MELDATDRPALGLLLGYLGLDLDGSNITTREQLGDLLSILIENADDLSISASEKALANKIKTSLFSGARLAGFFQGVAHAHTATAIHNRRLSLFIDDDDEIPAIFSLSYINGSFIAKTVDGLEVELSRTQIKQAGIPRRLEDALSIQNLRTMIEALNQNVASSLAPIAISTQAPIVLEIDIDFLPEKNTEFYLNYLLEELKAAKLTEYGDNTFFKIKGQNQFFVNQALETGLFIDPNNIPEVLQKAKTIKLAPAYKGLSRDFINTPVATLQDGDIPAFKASIQLAIYSGRIDLNSIPDGFVSAYGTLSGQKIDTNTLQRILKGLADITTAYKYALKAITRVPVNRAIQLFRNMIRMIGQAV